MLILSKKILVFWLDSFRTKTKLLSFRRDLRDLLDFFKDSGQRLNCFSFRRDLRDLRDFFL